MKTARKYLAIALAFLLSVLSVPANANESAVPTRALHGDVVIDTDPEGGYEGDYVIMCNPNGINSSYPVTGTLTGKIITSVNPEVIPEVLSDGFTEDPAESGASDCIVTEEDAEAILSGRLKSASVREEYPVGYTKELSLGSNDPDGNTEKVEFKVLYVGEHSRIWTPSSAGPNENYYPLDMIDESYAALAAESFDSKYDFMLENYGDYIDLAGDGRVNILYYNIKNQQYGGLFVASDLTGENHLTTIHIDTYPSVLSTNGSSNISRTFSTLEHEFQHLIFYSHVGSNLSWLTEAFSTSAEELCFGKAVIGNITTWCGSSQNFPKAESEYSSSCPFQKGRSLVFWQFDTKVYSLGLLFSQYLYTRTGSNAIYKQIIDNLDLSDDSTGCTSVASLLGIDQRTMWLEFIMSVVINSPSAGYGFKVQEGYDPSAHNGLENPYSLLCPVIYTSTKSVYLYPCGGFITVKPVGGVFTPPSDAHGVTYIGVKFIYPEPDGDADGNGTVEAADALLILRYYMSLLDSGINVEACDVNGDGKVDAIDALIVLRKAMGIT